MNLRQRHDRVLVVDDTNANLVLLNEVLSGSGYCVSVATNGADALESARRSPPDVILLDIMMPGMDGYEVLAELKSDKATAHIPVLLLSALDEPDSKSKGFELGACDYVIKPFQLVEVLARLSTHLRVADLERRLRWSEGAMREGERIARMGTWTSKHSTGEVEWSDELFGLFCADRSANLSIAEILEQAVDAKDLRRVKELFSDPVATLGGDRCVEFRLGRSGQTGRILRAMGREGMDRVSSEGQVFIGVVMDVSRILQDHQADLSRSKVHRRILDLHPDPYLRLDGKGRILEANDAMAHLLGRELPGIVGENLRILEPPDSIGGSFLEAVHRGLNSGFHRIQSTILARGGACPVEATLVSADDTGSDLALFLRAVVDRRSAE
ncbi:MAG TPA: response regulator [Fibrobacteria bacterium]|nr:response regulator [Fibrobacteria bacterium]